MSKKYIFICLVLYVFLMNRAAYPESKKVHDADHFILPFQVEELRYKVSWSKFVTAGYAQLSLLPGKFKENTDVLIGKAVAESAKWMKIFGIDVTDVIETFFDPRYEFSYFFQAKIKETEYTKTKSITFDWNNNRIEYIERDKLTYFELKEKTHDVLSALYYVRTLPLRVGESFFVPVFDEGKKYLLEIKVIALEALKIENIQIPAHKTKVLLKSKGIFNRKGDVYIWFSNDLRKIPVQMQCDIFLGFFHVVLANAREFFYYR